MIWKILKEPTDGGKPDEPWVDTGTTYDDVNGYIQDYLISLQTQNGSCYAASNG